MEKYILKDIFPGQEFLEEFLKDFPNISNIRSGDGLDNLINEFKEDILNLNLGSIQADGRLFNIQDYSLKKQTIRELIKDEESFSFRLENVQKDIKALFFIHRKINLAFHAKSNMNIYATSKNVQGLMPHKDVRDSLILQLDGKKKWNFPDLGKEVITNAGDFLFIPLGVKHRAETIQNSIHLTIAIDPKNIGNILKAGKFKDINDIKNITDKDLKKLEEDYKEFMIGERRLSYLTFKDHRPNYSNPVPNKDLSLNFTEILWIEELSEDEIEVCIKDSRLIFKGNSKELLVELFSKSSFRLNDYNDRLSDYLPVLKKLGEKQLIVEV